MKRIVSKFTLLIPILFVLMLSPAFADTLHVDEYQVTSSSAIETTPTIGNDGTSDLVVFTVQPLINGVPGAADIWYRRLDANGKPDGLSTQVTSAVTDDQLNDVSGDYIVYTAFENATSNSGKITLYRISDRMMWSLTGEDNVPIIQEARIHGNCVVWREGGDFSTLVMLYDLRCLGTPTPADVISGMVPVPTNYDVQHIIYGIYSSFSAFQTYATCCQNPGEEMNLKICIPDSQ